MPVDPYDEPAIEDHHVIIRRVNPDQHIVTDENTGKMRTSSKLFSPSSNPGGGMSIDLLNLIEKDGLDPKEFVTTPVFTGAVCFKAYSAREIGLMIGYDPIEADRYVEKNPYHGEVWNSGKKPNKFSGSQKRSLAKASSWFVELRDVEIGY